MLPVREEPKTIDYYPQGDENPPWLVGDWRGLSEKFSLRTDDLLDFHTALAGQGRPWTVVRRIYKIAAMWGESNTADDLREWTWKLLAETLGVAEARLHEDLDAAVDYWKKVSASQSVRAGVEKAAASGVKQVDGIPDFQIHQQLTDDQVASLLKTFRFSHLRDEDDRLYVANRILELKRLMDDKHKRESARQLIVMELSMASHEMTQSLLKHRLAALNRDADVTTKESNEVTKLVESIDKSEKALANLSKIYREAADELGGDEREEGETSRVALGTISHLVEAHRVYYLKGDRTLIDGMFTAAEVVWMTDALTIRPAQYRPDIVARMREAMIPENLWGKDYIPTVIEREACRRMAKIVQLLGEESEPAVIPSIDDVTSSPVDSDDPAELAEFDQPATQTVVLPEEMNWQPPEPEPCISIA